MPGRFNPDDYVDVQERINRFWSEHPDGAIFTELDPSSTFDAVVFRALVFKQRPASGGAFQNTPDATGYASEMKGGGGANATSWHENGETSAIGRALANMGYAVSRHDRPSRQEMNKAAREDIREHNNAQSAPQAPRPLPPSKPDYEQRSPSVLPPIQPGGMVSDTFATSAQLKAIEDIGERLGLTFADIDKIARDITGGPIEGIRNRQASTLIKHLGNLQRSGGQGDLGLKPAAMAAQ